MDQVDELFDKWDREEEERKAKKEEKARLYLMSREIDAALETDPFYLGW